MGGQSRLTKWLGESPPRDVPNPPRCKTPGSGPDSRQCLANPVLASVLTTSPSGLLFFHGMEPIRYTHFPKMSGQPSGLDSQALSQPPGVNSRGADRASWTQTPFTLPEEKIFHSVTSLSELKYCYLAFPPSWESHKTHKWKQWWALQEWSFQTTPSPWLLSWLHPWSILSNLEINHLPLYIAFRIPQQDISLYPAKRRGVTTDFWAF